MLSLKKREEKVREPTLSMLGWYILVRNRTCNRVIMRKIAKTMQEQTMINKERRRTPGIKYILKNVNQGKITYIEHPSLHEP